MVVPELPEDAVGRSCSATGLRDGTKVAEPNRSLGDVTTLADPTIMNGGLIQEGSARELRRTRPPVHGPRPRGQW